MPQTSRRGSTGPIWAVAIIAIILALASFGYAYIATTSGANSSEVNSLSTSVSSLNSAVSALTVVNQAPQTRFIQETWNFNDASQQDRFDPTLIVINQGDTVDLTFASNDTGDSHTFTLTGIPEGEFQLNDSTAGLTNFLTGATFTGAATGCMTNGQPVACNTHGTIGNLTSTGSFTVNQPGVYRFFCVYHQSIGMYGFLVVLPNEGYHS